VILEEGWYPAEADPLAPWQATDNAQLFYGQQRYKGNYVNGQRHGVQEDWYHNGRQQYKENYANGQLHGVQEAWFENGQQEYKLNYVNGQEHGIQERWYPDGQQAYKWNYVNGQHHGLQEEWNEDGQHKYRKYYLDGNEVSQQVYKSYVEGLAPEVQATIDFEEPNLSKVIAMYLLP
jgi:hypothetical protein